jgi:hypothetical protein
VYFASYGGIATLLFNMPDEKDLMEKAKRISDK